MAFRRFSGNRLATATESSNIKAMNASRNRPTGSLCSAMSNPGRVVANFIPFKMKHRKRIDRFIEDAVVRFADWIAQTEWLGKERDCVNLFATNFLLPAIHPDAAIRNYSQVRIECGVPQPACFNRPGAYKDLVIWRDPLENAYDSNWKPVNPPWIVIEWKTRRKGRFDEMFHAHDLHWLTEFTLENPDSFGYAVTVDFRKSVRLVHCAKIRNGKIHVKRKLTSESRE